MSRKESYSERLAREGGMVASGKFRERREATCECCHRNDAPVGDRFCVSCVRCRNEALASANADRHRLGDLLEEADAQAARYETTIAALEKDRDSWEKVAREYEAALADRGAL